MVARTDIDWDAVERLYRPGDLSLREIGRRAGADHSTVSRHAEKMKWTRDPGVEFRRRTKAARSAAAQQPGNVARQPGSSVLRDTGSDSRPGAAATAAAVGANAAIVNGHRHVLGQARGLAERILDQAGKLVAAVESEPVPPGITSATQRIIVLTRAADLMRSLIGSLSHNIPLERQAIGVDEQPPEPDAETIRAAIQEAKAELARRRIVRSRGPGLGEGGTAP